MGVLLRRGHMACIVGKGFLVYTGKSAGPRFTMSTPFSRPEALTVCKLAGVDVAQLLTRHVGLGKRFGVPKSCDPDVLASPRRTLHAWSPHLPKYMRGSCRQATVPEQAPIKACLKSSQLRSPLLLEAARNLRRAGVFKPSVLLQPHQEAPAISAGGRVWLPV